MSDLFDIGTYKLCRKFGNLIDSGAGMGSLKELTYASGVKGGYGNVRRLMVTRPGRARIKAIISLSNVMVSHISGLLHTRHIFSDYSLAYAKI